MCYGLNAEQLKNVSFRCASCEPGRYMDVNKEKTFTNADLLLWAHQNHAGIEAMRQALLQRWPSSAQKDIVDYVKECNHCRQKQRPGETAMSFRKPKQMDDVVGIDLLSTDQDGMPWVMVCRDMFSGMMTIEPLSTKGSQEVLTAILGHMAKLGPPKYIVYDEGSEFKGHFDSYLQHHGILHQWTTPGIKRESGVAERAVGITKAMLRVMRSSYPEEPFELIVRRVEMALNCNKRPAVG